MGQAADGSQRDLTDGATFASSNSGVIRIGKDGIAYPVSDGTAEVTVSTGTPFKPKAVQKAEASAKSRTKLAGLGGDTAKMSPFRKSLRSM